MAKDIEDLLIETHEKTVNVLTALDLVITELLKKVEELEARLERLEKRHETYTQVRTH